MKRVLLLLALVSTVKLSYSQCDPYKTFSSVHGYYVNKGLGVEAGIWPVEKRPFGLFVGSQVFLNSGTSENQTDIVFYSRGQYRFNRFVHATGALGINGFDKLYSSLGIRFSVPLSSGRRSAIVMDPQITSLGYKLGIGLVFALE